MAFAFTFALTLVISPNIIIKSGIINIHVLKRIPTGVKYEAPESSPKYGATPFFLLKLCYNKNRNQKSLVGGPMKYNAFISYRHTPLDMKVAKKLHKALETFRIPKSVRKKTGKKRIERVFRDQEELPIGSDLNENILNALTESEFLIVVCSPNTPKSEWVAKEIETFIRLHDRDHVLAILIDGEPEESFPKLLVTDEEGNNVEPLAADIRGVSSRERDKKFKTELLRLVAPLIGCTYDDIRQRHKERIIKRNLTIGFSAAGIIVLLAVIFGIYNASVAGKMALLAEEKSQLADQVQEEAHQRQISKSKYLAKLSLELWENGKPKEAVATAVSSYEKNENGLPVSSDSSYALSKVLDIYSLNYFKLENSIPHDFIIENSFMTDDYSKMISIDISGTVYVWNPENLELLCKIEPYDYYSSDIVGVSADDTYIYICLYDEIKKYDYNGKFIKKADRFDRYINGCDFHVSDQLVVLNTPSEIILFNLDTFRISKKIETDYKLLKGISYSPADNIVCIGGVRSGDEGQIDGFVIINLDTEETIFSDLPFPFHLKKSTFNPDGDIILYYGFEGTVGTESVWMDENRIALYSKEGMFLWEQSISHRPHEDMNHSDLFSYGVCQVNGETRYLVGVSIRNEILILDGISGEIIVEYPLSEQVTGLLVGNNAAIFSLADGSIHTLIYKSGYDNKLFESGIKNMQMFFCPKFETNGYSLVMQQENSSDLYSVAYQNPSAINNVELNGSFVDVSPTGNYFVFEELLDTDPGTYRYNFYGSNGKLLDSQSVKGYLSYLFIEDTMVFVNYNELAYYNPIEKTKEIISLNDLLGYADNYSPSFYIENNNPYLIGININLNYSELVIVDILNKEKIYEYKDDCFRQAAISPTGDYILLEKDKYKSGENIYFYS